MQHMTGVGIRRPRRGIVRHWSKHMVGDSDTFAPVFAEGLQFGQRRLGRDPSFNRPITRVNDCGDPRGWTGSTPAATRSLAGYQDIGARRHDANHFRGRLFTSTVSRRSAVLKRGLPQLVRENRDRRRRCLRIRPVGFPRGRTTVPGRPAVQSSEDARRRSRYARGELRRR